MPIYKKAKDYKEEDLFDEEFKALSHQEAVTLFGIKRLQPQHNPWDVVRLQIWMCVVVFILALAINVKLRIDGVVISVLAGALFGVFPNIAFIITMQLGKDSYKNSAKKFVYTLIYAELIKITFLLIIILLVVWIIPHLQWLPFLGMFIISLQAHWLQGIRFKFLFK